MDVWILSMRSKTKQGFFQRLASNFWCFAAFSWKLPGGSFGADWTRLKTVGNWTDGCWRKERRMWHRFWKIVFFVTPKLIQSIFHHFPKLSFFGIFAFHWSSERSIFRNRMEGVRKYLRTYYRLLHKLTKQICFTTNCKTRFSLQFCAFRDVYGHFHITTQINDLHDSSWQEISLQIYKPNKISKRFRLCISQDRGRANNLGWPIPAIIWTQHQQSCLLCRCDGEIPLNIS